MGFAEQPLRRRIHQFNTTFGRIANQTNAHMLNNSLEILKILFSFCARLAKSLEHLVKRILEIVVRRTQPGTGKRLGKILIANRLQKPREIALRALHIVYECPGLIDHTRTNNSERGVVFTKKKTIKKKTGGDAQKGHAQNTYQAKVFISHAFRACDKARCE